MAAVMMDTMRPMPIGYRFHPTDKEYLRHYLQGKNLGDSDVCRIIPEIDLCNWEPRDLPGKFRELSVILSDDPEWWFFCEQGQRAQRSTKEGFWKITGHDRKVMAREELIGTKKTLVFHEGKGRKAKRTSWVMHEYHLPTPDCSYQSTRKFTLCRIKCKEHDEHDSNTSSQSQRNNHLSPYFDDSVPLDNHLLPEDAVQAKMAWLLEPDSSQFMRSCLDPMLDHHVQTSAPCPLEPVAVSHHLKSSGLDYQNKEQTEAAKDFLNENPLAQQSGRSKKSCSLEPDSPHSGLHKRSSVDSLPDFTEDVYQKNKQAEDVKDFLNQEPKAQFGQPLVEVSNPSKDQATEVDSKKDTGLNPMDGVAEIGEDKGIIKESPPTQQREYVPIKQETSCSSCYLPKAGPELTVPKKKSRKIQNNNGMSNEPEPPNKIPRNKMQSISSTAATLQTEVDSWHANEGGGIFANRI